MLIWPPAQVLQIRITTLPTNYRNSGAFSDGAGEELSTITSDIAAAMGGSSGAGGGGTVSPIHQVSAVDGRQPGGGGGTPVGPSRAGPPTSLKS